MPCWPFLCASQRLDDLILTRANSICFDSSVNLFSILLLYKISSIVLLVPEDILMRRNRWWVLLSVPSDLLPLWLRSILLLLYPVDIFYVLPRSRSLWLILVDFILEPVYLWRKTVRWFNDSYSEFLQPEHWQVLSWLHALANLIKANSWLICSWAYSLLG